MTDSVRRTLQTYLDLPAAVRILCFGSFVNRAGSFVMIFLTIYIGKKLGLGTSFATACFGAFGLGSIIASLAGGQLADRFGRRPVMLFALFGAASLLVALGLAQNGWVFMALIFLFSLTADMYRPAASAMMGDLVDSAQRPLAFGLMYMAFNLGFAVAAPVGGLIAKYSFFWLFLGDAVTTALYGLIIVYFIKETLPQTADDNSKAVTNENGSGATWGESFAHIRGDTTFLLFSTATLLTSLVFMQAFSTLPIYMNQLGYSESEIGWLLSTNGVLIVICQIPITHALNRFHRVLVILAGELIIAVGFGLTTFAETVPMFLMTIVIWTLGEVIQAAFKQSLVADLAPQNMRGRYMGLFSLCHAIGLTVGAPIGGQILDRWGGGVLWPTCFVVVMLSAGVYFVVYLRLEYGHRGQPAPATQCPE